RSGSKASRFPHRPLPAAAIRSLPNAITEEGMAIRRTLLATLSTGLLLVGFFVNSCKDSESPSSPSAPGTATVMGTVVSGDAGSAGSALTGVRVQAVDSGQAAMTDGAGNFTITGVPGGTQAFQFSRSDIDGKGNIAVVGGATMAVDVRISNRSTVVITPRAGPNAPAQTETVTPTVTGTPPTSTPTSTAGATTPTPVGGCSKEEQIEGIVVTNSGGILTIFDQRLGTVTVTASATTIIRKGQTPVLFADIVVGWRVHVKACLVS